MKGIHRKKVLTGFVLLVIVSAEFFQNRIEFFGLDGFLDEAQKARALLFRSRHEQGTNSHDVGFG